MEHQNIKRIYQLSVNEQRPPVSSYELPQQAIELYFKHTQQNFNMAFHAFKSLVNMRIYLECEIFQAAYMLLLIFCDRCVS